MSGMTLGEARAVRIEADAMERNGDAGGDAAYHRGGIDKDDAIGLPWPQLDNVDQHLRPETAALLLSFVRPAPGGLPGRIAAATKHNSLKANCSRGRWTLPS